MKNLYNLKFKKRQQFIKKISITSDNCDVQSPATPSLSQITVSCGAV